VFEGRLAYELPGTLEVQPQRLQRDPQEAESLQLPRTLQRTDVIDGDEMCRRAGARALTGWQRRGRLPGPPFDVRPSGVDSIQEGEHPAPHLLGRRAIVVSVPRSLAQVALRLR
jgi:hypothetical protein